jgi:hypothetical protein
VTERASAPDKNREELVVIAAPMFPHKLSKGYNNPSGMVLASVNGTPIRSLSHLVTLLRDLKDEFVVFRFSGRAGETLVFPRKEMVTATDEILADNGVRVQGSSELMKIWENAPAK